MGRFPRQMGISLVSMMIAMAIGLFLLAVLFDIWYSTQATLGNEQKLTKLQNRGRLALTIMANTVRSAGYYPNYLNYKIPPPNPTYSPDSFTASGAFALDQFLSGTHGTSDTLSVRFVADTGTSTLDCLGQQEATGTVVVNTFSVNNGDLQCSVNGATAQTIVSGVNNLLVLYGVDPQQTGSPVQYVTANKVQNWLLVRSVDIELTFDNPLSGPGQAATITPINRVVALMQQAS